MAIVQVRDTKTGKVLRTVDTKTNTVVSGGFSGSSSGSNNTSSKRSSSSGLQARIVDARTGQVVQEGVFSVQRPSTVVKGGSTSRSGQTGVIDVTNTQTGVRTVSKVDLDTGKTIQRTSQKLTPQQIQLQIQQQRALSNRPSIQLKTSTLANEQAKRQIFNQLRQSPQTLEAKVTRALTPKVSAGRFEKIGKGALSSISGDVFGTVALAKMIKQGKIKNLKPAEIVTGVKEYGRTTLQDLASGDNFRQARAVTDIATWFIPITLPKKISKILNAGDNVANSVTKYEAKKSLTTGSMKFDIKTTGLTQNNKNFKQTAKLRFNPQTKNIIGTVETKVGKKTYKDFLNLKEEVGFYVDKKTGIKIPKSQVTGSTAKVKLKEIEIQQRTPDTLQIKGEVKRTGALRDVTVTKTDLVDIGKQRASRTTTRVSEVKSIIENDKKIIKANSQQLLKEKDLNLKTFKQKTGLTDKEIKNFLIQTNYKKDKSILKRLDLKLTKPKKEKLLKKLEIVFDEGQAKLITRKGSVKVAGQFEEVNVILARFGISKPKLKGGKLLKTDVEKISKYAKRLDIPDLRVMLKRVRSLRVRGVLGLGNFNKILKQIRNRIKDLQKKKASIKIPKSKQIKVPKQDRIPKTKKKTLQKTKQIKKPITRTINKQKPKVTPKVPKIPKIPRLRLPDKPIKFKLPRLRFGTKLPKGQQLAFSFRYREKGKVKVANVNLPYNRAVRKAKQLIDNTTGRSMEVFISGVTKAKDIGKSPDFVKFRPRKTTKALKLVEKPKYLIDTKGEKRGLSVSRALQQTKKRKPSKSIKKPKKVSKNRSKQKKSNK